MMKFIKFRALRGFIIAEPVIIVAATFMLVAYPLATQPHGEKARQTTCTSNQKQLALATAMYIQENDEMFPPVGNDIGELWRLIDVRGKISECPSNRNDRSFSYAYNANLSNLSLGKVRVPEEVVLTADSDREDGKMTEAADIALRHRNRERESVCAILSFTDGHVALHNEERVNNVKFN